MLRAFNRSNLSSERGLTIVEVMFGALILSVGMFSSVRVFAASHDGSLSAQRNEIASHVAQKHMEQLRTFKYDALVLDGNAVGITGEAKHTVSGAPGNQELVIRTHAEDSNCPIAGCKEKIVSAAAGAGKVEPVDSFNVKQGDGVQVTGDIYRYVTWRDELCPTVADCDTDAKSIAVAVVVDPVKNGIAPMKPVWISSVVVDRNARPAGKVAPDAAAITETGTNLFLYNKACGSGDSYTTGDPAAHNPTHNTASYGTASGEAFSTGQPNVSHNPSYCENTNSNYQDTNATGRSGERRRPDLMGPTQPTPADDSYVMPNYSADTLLNPPGSPLMLSREDSPVAGGLIMRRGLTSTCPSGVNAHYSSDQDQLRDDVAGGFPSAGSKLPNRWNHHAWSSRKPTNEVRLRSKAVLDFHAIGRNGGTGTGRLCISLVRREFVSNASEVAFRDVVLADANDPANSGDDACRFDLTDDTNFHNFRCTVALSTGSPAFKTDSEGDPYWEIPGANRYRVMLVVTIPSDSDTDLVLGYDSQDTSSFLQLSCDPNLCNIEE